MNCKSRILALIAGIALPAGAVQAQWVTPTSQMEKLDRGVVAFKGKTNKNFISWRLLGTDNPNVTFNVMRNGTVIKSGISGVTYYQDNVSTAQEYQVQTVLDGKVIETSPVATSTTGYYFPLNLDRPAGGTTPAGDAYTYSPCDCSVGEVEGDGQYEIIVKWDPSNSKDNSQAGYTGNVYLDCYKLDGTKLWRIDLGKNIRAGAHYTQFLVYDFDGDGKAEVVCKTAPGSKDGDGKYVSSAADDATIQNVDNTKDWRYTSGRNIGKMGGGQEWLTIFCGATGNAIHTIFYNPNRNGGLGGEAAPTKNWKESGTDTSYGNRGERYLATVAYLDGPDKNPSAVMGRGYYTYAYLWAVDFDGSKLKTRWLHVSESKNKVTVTDANGKKTTNTYYTNTGNSGKSCTLYANGNHNLSCADVDGDGKDEILYGSAAVDDDGSLLYAVGWGHGDAMHVSKLIPDRAGLQVFDVHEEDPYGWDVHDAATGEVLYYASGANDNGRGLAADIMPNERGFQFWSSNDRTVRSAVTGESVSGAKSQPINFRVYWGGTLKDDLLDGTSLKDYAGKDYTLYMGQKVLAYGHSASCNSTKSTPCLAADLFGDWREEIIMWDSSNSSALNIFSSSETTKYRIPTLMHDHTYRMGITWQNTAYNQPPHLGFYLPDYVAQATAIKSVDADVADWIALDEGGELRLDVPAGTSVSVAIHDVSGRICWSKTVTGAQKLQIPTLSPGTYMLKAVSGGNVFMRKFLNR